MQDWCLTVYKQHSIIHKWSWKNTLFRRSISYLLVHAEEWYNLACTERLSSRSYLIIGEHHLVTVISDIGKHFPILASKIQLPCEVWMRWLGPLLTLIILLLGQPHLKVKAHGALTVFDSLARRRRGYKPSPVAQQPSSPSTQLQIYRGFLHRFLNHLPWPHI